MTTATREPDCTTRIVEGGNECDGPGKCHGCMCWCDNCGDVRTVCHAETCDRHRCTRCNVMLTAEECHDGSDWHLFCRGCLRQANIEDTERNMLAAEEAGWPEAATTYARYLQQLLAESSP